jgi:cytoskeleton protein RodZ
MTDAARSEARPASVDAAPVPGAPGARLAEARVARGLSVEGVAQQLKFSPRQIAALEQDRYDALPGVAVLRGMVRGYARLVDLDPDPLLEALKASVAVPDANQIIARYHEPVPFSDGSKRSNVVYLVLSVAVLVVAGVVAVQWYQDRPKPERMTFVPAAKPVAEPARTTLASAGGAAPAPPLAGDSAPRPPATPGDAAAKPNGEATAAAAVAPDADSGAAQDAAAVAPAANAAGETTGEAAGRAPQTAAASQAAAATPAPAPDMHRVELEFGEESWVEIRNAQGKVVFSRLNAAGSKASVEGDGPLSFVIGNAPSVRLTYDGHSVDLGPYTKVAVARFTLP